MTYLTVDTEPASGSCGTSCLRDFDAACLIGAVQFRLRCRCRNRADCRCDRERAKLLFDDARVIKIIHAVPLLLHGQRSTHALQFVFGAVGAVGVVDEPVEDVRL